MKHDIRGRRRIPGDIDFIVIRRVGTDGRTVRCKRIMRMKMHRTSRPMLELFRMNMAKRRLQESPQERKNATEAAGPHRIFLKVAPHVNSL